MTNVSHEVHDKIMIILRFQFQDVSRKFNASQFPFSLCNVEGCNRREKVNLAPYRFVNSSRTKLFFSSYSRSQNKRRERRSQNTQEDSKLAGYMINKGRT